MKWEGNGTLSVTNNLTNRTTEDWLTASFFHIFLGYLKTLFLILICTVKMGWKNRYE